MALNKFIGIGRLVKEPETREVSGGNKILKGTMAINNSKDNTTFVNFTAWNKTAELIQQYIKKGEQFTIEGSLKIDTYDKKVQVGESGGEITVPTKIAYINVDRVIFLNNKGDNE